MKLYKSKKNYIISGVCGGLAEALKIDPSIVRLIWAISTIFYGVGLAIYIVCAIILPYEDGSYDD